MRRARAPSGRRSTPSTTAASSPSWSSTRRWPTSRSARGAWSRTGCSATPVQARPRRRPTPRGGPRRARRAHGRGAGRGRVRRIRGDRRAAGARGAREVSDAFFVPLGDGRYRATERTSGPWDPRHQHAGPPSRAAHRRARADGAARRTWCSRGSRSRSSARCRSARSRSRRRSSGRGGPSSCSRASCGRTGARCCARGRGGCWRRRSAPTTGGAARAARGADTPPPALLGETFGYAHAVEWRWAVGGWEERGPATVWTRMRIPVVEGEEPTPRQRVMVVADSGNGASNVLDWDALPVHQHRADGALPARAGGRVGAAWTRETQLAEGGAGLAASVLSDRSGPVARGAQALLVAPTMIRRLAGRGRASPRGGRGARTGRRARARDDRRGDRAQHGLHLEQREARAEAAAHAAAERDPRVGAGGLSRGSARGGTRTGPGRRPRGCARAGCSVRRRRLPAARSPPISNGAFSARMTPGTTGRSRSVSLQTASR